ncbi:LytR/AlgR family response regulator transcription factor [Sphingosinithalassobacter portus]|uniref:LytR/AlgR family response regulator transcription factor n=1 Tax=Stakelama portus TaxID=2676234 RepID=UPI000D6DD5C6|nr:response regulator [Sphingosinithalassobacter portus]
MNILLIEDEAPKRDNIRSLLEQMGLIALVSEARSVGSAIRALRTSSFDLVILDMSLPTFDIAVGESGGRPQGFGGVEVLRYMDRFKLRSAVIVVTAYPAFSEGNLEIDLKSLTDQLRDQHPTIFKGIVFYNSMFSEWREELRVGIEGLLRDENSDR